MLGLIQPFKVFTVLPVVKIDEAQIVIKLIQDTEWMIICQLTAFLVSYNWQKKRNEIFSNIKYKVSIKVLFTVPLWALK